MERIPMSFSEIEKLTSPENSIDPRVKLFMLLSISLLAVYYTEPFSLSMLLLVTIFVMMIAKISFREVKRILLPLVQLSIPVIILQALFHQEKGFTLISISTAGEPVILVGTSSLSAGLTIVLKIMVIASASLAFSLTTRPEELLQGLRAMRIPHEIAYMTGLVLYFLPVIRNEIDETRDALAIKGFSLARGSLKARLKVLNTVLVSTFLNFTDKARYQAMSMEARGFRCQKKVTFIQQLDFGAKDSIILVLTIVSSVFLGVLYLKG